MRILLVVSMTLLLLGGCGNKHKYQPTLYGTDPVKFGALNTASIGRPVAINNVQDDDESVKLGNQGLTQLYGSKRDLTETIVMNTERELAKRQVSVNPEAEQKLDIRVTDASVDAGPLNIEAVLDVEVVTGDGTTKRYHIENKTPGSLDRAYNGAAALAVIEILSDQDILRYLSR